MELLRPADAARELGISYPTLKQWIYNGRLTSIRTPGGHHRIPRDEIRRLADPGSVADPERGPARGPSISGRNKLRGTVVGVRSEGLLSEVRLDVNGQLVTAIITRGAAEDLGLRPGVQAQALIKATEVMVIRE